MNIIGDGPLKNYLNTKHLNKNINFYGELPNNETLNIINKSMAVVTGTKLFEGQPTLLCEASYLNSVSIFPKIGGIEEFFPKNYELAYEKGNEKDLISKFNMLTDLGFISTTAKQNYNHITNLLDEKELEDKFYLITNANKTPKVSVVMSTFNDELTIENSVKSILEQTYTNYEFLIMDDCSTDNTYKILEKFKESNNQIKIFKNKSNLGLTKSLNILIQNSTGEYIVRQDADDISHKMRISIQIDTMLQNNLDFCSTRAYIMGTKKLIPGLSFYIPLKILIKYKNPIIHGSLVISKRVFENVGNYNESYYYAQDYELIKRFIFRKLKYKIIKKPLYVLNMKNNISNKFLDQQNKYANMAKKAKYL